jgi:hypothetical protein
MKNHGSVRRIATLGAVFVLAFIAVQLSLALKAQESREQIILSTGFRSTASSPTPTPTPSHPTPTAVAGSVTLKQMQGSWTAALSGVTGCGVSTLSMKFTLDAQGKGTQTSSTEHTAACGEIDHSGDFAEIQSLNPDGSGFIAFGCGVGCGFGFTIQVSHNKEIFNMAPESVPGNYLAGVAVRR